MAKYELNININDLTKDADKSMSKEYKNEDYNVYITRKRAADLLEKVNKKEESENIINKEKNKAKNKSIALTTTAITSAVTTGTIDVVQAKYNYSGNSALSNRMSNIISQGSGALGALGAVAGAGLFAGGIGAAIGLGVAAFTMFLNLNNQVRELNFKLSTDKLNKDHKIERMGYNAANRGRFFPEYGGN